MRKNRQTAKYHIKSYIIAGSLAGAISMALALPVPVMAAQQSLASVTGQAQIQPMGDGSGKYMMKSDGFYCLDVNGAGSTQAEIHYFQDYEIDGTVFDGYYYHDTDGKFKACSPHMEHLKGVAVFGDKTDEEADTQNAQEAEKFDGYYFVNNLGRLSAAPQVRYIDNLAIDGITLNGYYYFDENGRLVTEPGIHSLEMDCYEMNFDGSYYFGGTNGALLQESTVTDDGFIVDDTGKIVNMDNLGMDNLKPQLEKMLSGYQGTWSVYVKDLNEEKEILINDTSLYSASLIKAFVMAKTYEDMEQVKADEAKKLNTADTKTVDVKLNDLLWNMITVSDNESFNELVRLQTASGVFKDGAQAVNGFLAEQKFADTSVQHILSPSSSKDVGLGGRNTTSVKDCAELLSRIYKGECVSKEASEAMLNLLLNQQVTTKIPSGISVSVEIANKTGETDTDQHDIAIVYGEKTTYILCVMSEDCKPGDAVSHIRDISGIVYNYLNMDLDQG